MKTEDEKKIKKLIFCHLNFKQSQVLKKKKENYEMFIYLLYLATVQLK